MKIVALSGVSGCGKTSVVKQLSEVFCCPYLLFDDYTEHNTYPTDMKGWFDNGANISLIRTPRFVSALRQLKTQGEHEYIFIEEPFGRCRDLMAPLIDYVVLLDQPMEVCLSRLIMRHIKHSPSDPSNSIAEYLLKYDSHLRQIYIEATNQVRENCDLVIERVASVELTSESISDWLKSKTDA
jgi:uridine kinase